MISRKKQWYCHYFSGVSDTIGISDSDQECSDEDVETIVSVLYSQQEIIVIADNVDENLPVSSCIDEISFEKTQEAITATTNDCAVPQGSCEQGQKNVVTNDQDSIEEGLQGIEPTIDHSEGIRRPTTSASYENECQKQVVDSGEETTDNGEVSGANREPDECAKDLEIKALKKQIISLNDQAKISEAKILVMSRKTQQRRLGEDLRIKFLEKKEELERELIEASINLRYQMEKNRRLEFRDKLRERVILMFEQIQEDFFTLKKENAALLAEKAKDTDCSVSDTSNENGEKDSFFEVNE